MDARLGVVPVTWREATQIIRERETRNKQTGQDASGSEMDPRTG